GACLALVAMSVFVIVRPASPGSTLFPYTTLFRSLILYAPTWRDGAIDPAIPDEEEAESIRTVLEELGAHLVVRPHRLGVGSYAQDRKSTRLNSSHVSMSYAVFCLKE